MTDKKYNFQYEMEVRDYELDSEKIVNNSVYLHYLEHTRHKFCEKVGFPFIKMIEKGIIAVVRKIEIEYFEPLHSGEKFISCLSIKREGVRFVFHQDIFKDSGEKVVESVVTVVALKNGKLSRGDEIAEVFSEYLN